MSGFASGGAGESSQSSQSGLRGTEYEKNAANLANQAAQDLYAVGRRGWEQPLNSQGQTQYMGFTGSQMLPGGQYGLGSNADAGVLELARKMFGFTSGNMGSRGFVSPENTQGVVGSAITAALPQLIPQMQAWQQAQFQAPMQIGQYSLGQAQAPAQQAGSNLGSSSQGSSSYWNFGAGGGAAPQPSGYRMS